MVLNRGSEISPASVLDLASQILDKYGLSARWVYRYLTPGFAVETTPEAAEQLAQDPNVAYVSQDYRMRLHQEIDPLLTVNETEEAAEETANSLDPVRTLNEKYPMQALTAQASAPYHLDRIDQRALPLNSRYVYSATGTGVNLYVVDSGIRLTHSQFGGRAQAFFDAFSASNPYCNGRTEVPIQRGHGTHVAGIAGGATYGAAKSVRLLDVRVADCDGTIFASDVQEGLDRIADARATAPVVPTVVNLSLGGPVGAVTAPIETAVTILIDNYGVTVVVAAGNDNADACNTSPARVPGAITVAATAANDARASYSNFGSCLDVFAPGDDVTSAYYTSDTATQPYNGTSQAAPLVAGAVAKFLEGYQTSGPQQVAYFVTGNATAGVVTNAGAGSPNRLLYSPHAPRGEERDASCPTYRDGRWYSCP